MQNLPQNYASNWYFCNIESIIYTFEKKMQFNAIALRGANVGQMKKIKKLNR